MSQFEQYKTQVATDIKTSKINNSFEKELANLKLDPTVNEYTIRGFKSAVTEKYAIDLEEDGAFIVKDKKTGERLKSKEKDRIILERFRCTIEGSNRGRNHSKESARRGKVPKQTPFVPIIEQQNNAKLSKINPRFYTK